MFNKSERLLEQPVPEVSPELAASTALRVFGIDGVPSPLTSERDRNFHIETKNGSFALKFANPAEGAAVLAMQAAALDHIAATEPDLPVPRNRLTVDGDPIGTCTIDDQAVPVRMVTFLPGATVPKGFTTGQLRKGIAGTLARLGYALRGFFHPAGGRTLLWDLTHLSELRDRVHHLDPAQRSLVESELDRFDENVAPVLRNLRAQIIHNDLNPDNLLVEPTDPNQIVGIIDFGDMVHAPLIVDLAVAAAYQILGEDDPTDVLPQMAAAYHAVEPLEAGELDLLADLVAGRQVQSLVIGAWRACLHPDNTEYILDYQDASWAALQKLSELDRDALSTAIRNACGLPPMPPAPSPDDRANLMERRHRRLGSGMKLSYSEPLHAVAADGAWITDSAGVRYLDAYNNVPHVGHSHPTVTGAIAQQAKQLNTNTRYLTDQIVDYSDRLVDLLPDELSVVLFANSGSEANDLAWRIARTVTGNDGFLVTHHAYHGATYLTMATSPEELGIENLEPWVATVSAPDGHSDKDDDFDRAIGDLADRGYRPAAFACDTVFSSDGIFDVPAGYLRCRADQIRNAGGMFIADEVQAGFGRVGERMWGFAGDDVVPDIVTLGKPMGNGHPVAAVVTTPAIAETFYQRGYYFSTFAGNPVSAAAASAVLDVLAFEGLPAKADRVGEYLREGLSRLAERYPFIGDVRGPGMFIGVAVETDGKADAVLARTLVNELRNRRILVGRTGQRGNVLKIRPPLAFDESHADLLINTLLDVARHQVDS